MGFGPKERNENGKAGGDRNADGSPRPYCDKWGDGSLANKEILNERLSIGRKAETLGVMMLAGMLRGEGLNEETLDIGKVREVAQSVFNIDPRDDRYSFAMHSHMNPGRAQGPLHYSTGPPGPDGKPQPASPHGTRGFEVVVYREAQNEPFTALLRDMVASSITRYELETKEGRARPLPGLTDLNAARNLTASLERPGMRLVTLQYRGELLGFYLMFNREADFPEQARKTVDALIDRRLTQGRETEFPDGPLGYGAMVGLLGRARQIGAGLGQNPMDVMHEGGCSVAREDGVVAMLGTIRTYPNINVPSFEAHGRRGWITTSAVTDQSINDGRGTKATVLCCMLPIAPRNATTTI